MEGRGLVYFGSLLPLLADLPRLGVLWPSLRNSLPAVMAAPLGELIGLLAGLRTPVRHVGWWTRRALQASRRCPAIFADDLAGAGCASRTAGAELNEDHLWRVVRRRQGCACEDSVDRRISLS